MRSGITFISAGAGSGKTHRLTEILHTKLASGEVRPSGVIATTFTVKAAAELRERTRAYLMGRGEFELATAMDQARIGTVNSVCGELLLRFAFEAGLPTEQQVLGEAQGHALLAQAIDGVSDGPQLQALTALAERLGIDRWQDDLKRLVDQVRANDIAPSLLAGMADANADDLIRYFPKAASEDLDQALIRAIDEALPILDRAIATKPQKNTNEYLQLCREVRAKLTTRRTVWSEWAKLAKASPGARLRSAVEQVTIIAARHDEHPGLHADVRSYLKCLFALCAAALTEYAERKRELGLIDFVDQEHLLLEVLDHSEVRATLQDELDLLLVDEFQDTSPIQLAVFLKLAGLAREVYWVGDVKQAIYGFRGSDTALMQAVLESLTPMGGRKQILASSHRSRPPLVALVNAAFGEAFAPLLQRDEVELKAERTEPGTGPAFANWLLGGRNIDEQIAALGLGIRRLLESGYKVVDKQTREIRQARHADIAVLARQNDRVMQIATRIGGAGNTDGHGATGPAEAAGSRFGDGLPAPAQRCGGHDRHRGDSVAGRVSGARGVAGGPVEFPAGGRQSARVEGSGAAGTSADATARRVAIGPSGAVAARGCGARHYALRPAAAGAAVESGRRDRASAPREPARR